MKLVDVVAKISDCDDELTIYAPKPWSCDSLAVLAREPDIAGRPPEAETHGADYFLEVFVAKEFLDGWLAGSDRVVSAEEKCARLIHYAIYDA